MCLTFDWFDNSPSRIKKWDEDGLSLEEAKGSLGMYYSTVYPIGVEVAEYILKNWTARRVAMLGQESRKTLFEIWDKHLCPDDTDKDSVDIVKEPSKAPEGFEFKSIFFESRTKLRLRDDPSETAEIVKYGISYKGKIFTSFSAAANEARPHTQNNGWIQWEYFDKKENQWLLVDHRRKTFLADLL